MIKIDEVKFFLENPKVLFRYGEHPRYFKLGFLKIEKCRLTGCKIADKINESHARGFMKKWADEDSIYYQILREAFDKRSFDLRARETFTSLFLDVLYLMKLYPPT